MNKKTQKISVPLLVFTFIYALGIYTIMLGFYFWHWHATDQVGIGDGS